MSDVGQTAEIEQTDTTTEAVPELPNEHPGVEDGTVLTTPVEPEEPGGEVREVQEKIVYEYDAEGNQVGWHKEVVA